MHIKGLQPSPLVKIDQNRIGFCRFWPKWQKVPFLAKVAIFGKNRSGPQKWTLGPDYGISLNMCFQRKNGPGPIWDRSGNCGNCKFRKFAVFGIFIKIGKFSSSGLARIQEFEKHGLNICLAMVHAPDMVWKALVPCSKLDQPWNML